MKRRVRVVWFRMRDWVLRIGERHSDGSNDKGGRNEAQVCWVVVELMRWFVMSVDSLSSSGVVKVSGSVGNSELIRKLSISASDFPNRLSCSNSTNAFCISRCGADRKSVV